MFEVPEDKEIERMVIAARFNLSLGVSHEETVQHLIEAHGCAPFMAHNACVAARLMIELDE